MPTKLTLVAAASFVAGQLFASTPGLASNGSAAGGSHGSAASGGGGASTHAGPSGGSGGPTASLGSRGAAAATAAHSANGHVAASLKHFGTSPPEKMAGKGHRDHHPSPMRTEPVSRYKTQFDFPCIDTTNMGDEKLRDDSYWQNCRFGPVKNRAT